MSFGGSVAAMISSMKNNRKLLSQRKTFKDKASDNHYHQGQALKYKELPEAELNEVKAKIRAKLQLQNRIRVAIAIVLTTGMAYIMLKFVIG